MAAKHVKYERRYAKVLPHRVYTREKWEDDWELIPEVHCSRVSWCASPSLPEATIYYRYGSGRLPKDDDWSVYERFTLPSLGYVKIEFDVYEDPENDPVDPEADPEVTTHYWFGVVGTMIDQSEGGFIVDPYPASPTDPSGDPASPTKIPSGFQTFRCVGLEWLLDRHYIRNATVYEQAVDPQPGDPPGEITQLNHAPAFAQNYTEFYSLPVFENKGKHAEASEWWTTENCVKYLLEWQVPYVEDGSLPIIPWELINESTIPTWDRQTFEQHGQTTGSILRRLISRQRGFSFNVTVDPNTNKAQLRPFSFTTTSVDFGDGKILSANPNDSLHLYLDGSVSSDVLLVRDAFARFDRVRVIGARATTTYSSNPYTVDLDLEADSIGDDTGLAGINDLDSEAQVDAIQRWNANPLYADKFRRYRISFTDRDDEEATQMPDPNPDPVPDPGPDPPHQTVREKTFYADKAILPRTRLRLGEDYENDEYPSTDDDFVRVDPTSFMRPFCLFEIYDETGASGKWIDSRFISESLREGFTWHASVAPVSNTYLTFDFDVQGAYRFVINSKHLLASDDKWVALLGSRQRWDTENAIVTCTIHMDHYCEAVAVPEIPDPPPDPPVVPPEMIREKVIRAGDNYRLDWLQAGTVVGVKPSDGSLIKHTTGHWIQDNRSDLESFAKLALNWYGDDRVALKFETAWITENMVIGNMVVSVHQTVDDPDAEEISVNAPLTSIIVELPIGDSQLPGIQRVSYSTSFAELDVING